MKSGNADPSDPATPAPRTNSELFGHEAAESALRRLFEAGRLPHALLLSGPRGIGKATLAFRFARFVLARGGGGAAARGLFRPTHTTPPATPPHTPPLRRTPPPPHPHPP